MRHESNSQSISWFQNHYKAGRLVLRPPFQRKPVWTDKQRHSLIESILMNIPVPEVYVQITHDNEGNEELGVVDGQQRLRTILQFIGLETEADREGDDVNRFSLSMLPTLARFKDAAFADLTPEQRKDFYQYQICVRSIFTDDLLEVEDMFKRLNKFTMPLKPQELRNATYHGAFARLSERLADDEYWAVNRIVSAAQIRRMADIEMMSDLLIGLIHGPQGGAAKVIDQYYEQYEPYEDEFPEQNRIFHTFSATLDAIKKIFPAIDTTTRWANKADFYSLFVALGTMIKSNTLRQTIHKKLANSLDEFARAVDSYPSSRISEDAKAYARAIERGSNDKARRTDRHEALLKIISPYFIRGGETVSPGSKTKK